jgi:hypothetical protein
VHKLHEVILLQENYWTALRQSARIQTQNYCHWFQQEVMPQFTGSLVTERLWRPAVLWDNTLTHSDEAALYHQQDFWYSFPLEPELTPWPYCSWKDWANWKIQLPLKELNPWPSSLQQSASISYATACPLGFSAKTAETCQAQSSLYGEWRHKASFT